MLAFNKLRWFPVSLNAEFDLQMASSCFLWRWDECTVDAHPRISRPTEADRQRSCSSCLIKRFVCERESDGPSTLLAQRVFSSINFPFHYSISCGPIGGSTYWWPLLSSASMTKVNILYGLSLSFFISLSSSFHPPVFTLSPASSSSFTLTPSWFCLFFSISEMKASPQLLSLLLKRPKWGGLSDEPLIPPLFRHTETLFFAHTCMLIHMSC